MNKYELTPWWGFSEKYEWVYLDRSLKTNQSPSNHLIFVQCKSKKVIDVVRSEWDEPSFWFEGRIRELAKNDPKVINAISQLENFKTQESEFRAESRFCFEVRQNAKNSNPPTDKKPHGECYRRSFNKKTPEHVRTVLSSKYDFNDEEWTEIVRYCAWMRELSYSDQIQLNNHITRNHQWRNFPAIRALNDHGYGSKIEGIVPKAYRAVCEILNLQRGSGTPLIHSERY